MAQEWTPFRREVRKRLIEKDMSSKELMDRINEAAGRHYCQ